MTEGLTNQRPQKSNLQQPNHDSDHGCLLTLSQVTGTGEHFTKCALTASEIFEIQSERETKLDFIFCVTSLEVLDSHSF